MPYISKCIGSILGHGDDTAQISLQAQVAELLTARLRKHVATPAVIPAPTRVPLGMPAAAAAAAAAASTAEIPASEDTSQSQALSGTPLFLLTPDDNVNAFDVGSAFAAMFSQDSTPPDAEFAFACAEDDTAAPSPFACVLDEVDDDGEDVVEILPDGMIRVMTVSRGTKRTRE